MRRRTCAFLALLAATAITVVLLQERERAPATTATESPAPRAVAEPGVELAAPQLVGEPLGRAEAAPVLSATPNVRPVPSLAQARPAPELGEAADTVLVFRALDEAGRAVAGELILTTRTATKNDWGSSGGRASADADGRFEVRIEPILEGERRELEVDARAHGLVARIDLSRAFPPGRIDMGDLVLGAAPLIAAGRVIDASGQPVAEASLVAHTLIPSPDGTVSKFESIYQIERTLEDGTFRLHGFTSAARVEIRLHHEHLRALPVTLPVGSRGIEIVAQRGGSVAGQVLVEPEVPLGSLRLILRPENVPADSKVEYFDSSSSSRKRLARDGRFKLEGLLPWTYTFSIASERDVLAEIPGIEIVAGEITHDRRLEPVDLRGRLHVFTLELVLPSPSFLLSGSVLFTASGTSTPVRRQYFNRSPVFIVTPLAAIDAVVRARDCRIERLSALAERTEVHLRAGFPVRLVLPRDVVLPDPPLFVSVELVREDERPEERTRSYSEAPPTPPFDENGESSCRAREPGRHAVSWFVERRGRSSGSSTRLDLPFDQVVVVEDREGEQRFELTMTNGALAAAIEAR